MGLKFRLLVLNVCIAASLDTTIGWEYCLPEMTKKLCPGMKGVKPSVCDWENAIPIKNKMQGKVADKFMGHVPMTRKFKGMLMDIHNDYRNRIAGGTVISTSASEGNNKFPIAARMRELIWDNELMYLAHLQTSQVTMAHDKCRGAQRFPYSGQNLGWKGVNNAVPILDMVQESLLTMYNEKNDIPDPVETVALYNASNFKGKASVGHFTLLMQDMVGRMGCALALGANCSSGIPEQPATHKVLKRCYYFACHYDSTNLNGKFIYINSTTTPGTMCSVFGVGMSKKYENLCANAGKYIDPIIDQKKYKKSLLAQKSLKKESN